MIIKLITLLKSLLPVKINCISNNFIIVKDTPLDSSKKYIWHVVEYYKYKDIRDKKIGQIKLEAGIKFTNDFFFNLSEFYKVLILTCDDFSEAQINLKNYLNYDVVIFVNNDGLDLGAHKQALNVFYHRYQNNNRIPLILSNSSFIPKSIDNIKKLLKQEITDAAIIGSSFCYGPKYFIIKKFHLQSFFLVSSANNLFKIFRDLSLSGNNKYKVIRNGELKISINAIKNGLKIIIFDGYIYRIYSKIGLSFFSYDYRIYSKNKNTL